MRHEVQHCNLILHVKRRFVHFVSHEMRTPLNTVCVDLELLDGELEHCSKTKPVNKMKTVSSKADPAAPSADSEDEMGVASCGQITTDIIENANCAMDLLNDLLDSNKIETGTLKLEIGTVDMSSLVEKNVHPFNVKAACRKLQMKTSSESPVLGDDSNKDMEADCKANKDSLVIGDDLRLGQCLRNILRFVLLRGSHQNVSLLVRPLMSMLLSFLSRLTFAAMN